MKRWLLRGAIVALGIVFVLAVGLVGLRAARADVLPGTRVGGIEVGGMDRATLQQVVSRLARRRMSEKVRVTRGDKAVTATNAQLGYSMDVTATVDAVYERGRQTNPLEALADHLRAFNGSTRVPPQEQIAPNELAAWIDEAANALRRRVQEPTVTFEGAEAVVTPARAGERVRKEALRRRVRRAVLVARDDVVQAPTTTLEPSTTPAEVRQMRALAGRAVAAPIRLSRGDAALTLTPEQIGATLRVERSTEDDGPVLRFRADADALASVVDDAAVDAVESEPVNASVEIVGGGPEITPSAPGFAFVPGKAAKQVAALARRKPGDDGTRTAQLRGESVAPETTTAEVRELGITEVVSSFTTEHDCCESRVTNIHRFADIMDGQLVKPGETISLNGVVGKRTTDKGFVGGGAISGGEYVEQVGGGVSQFATTFFNAAWFGGYDIVDYKAHSYYISRYPMGRESTINYPNVDVKVRNNSPYGLLVKTSYTDTSITVTFWGTEWVAVDTIAGEASNFTSPETIYQENNDLPVGSEQVVQSGGGQGFDIVVTRVLDYSDGGSEREEYFTRYLAEARVVERNTP
ncbi:MAG: VanW family protein [Egibacteraceae bacterium]